jgi:hypothetical protein
MSSDYKATLSSVDFQTKVCFSDCYFPFSMVQKHCVLLFLFIQKA